MITAPLKHVAEVWFSSVDKKTVDGQVPVRLCNYTDVYYNDRITPDMPFMEATATPEQVARFSLKRGDVLLTKDSETADDIGVSAVVSQDMPGVLCGYHLAMARPRQGTDGRFLRWALAASASRGQLEVAATGVTRFGLRHEAVAGMEVPAPSLTVQRAIADYLDAETARIDAIIRVRRKQHSLLDERQFAMLSQMLVPLSVPMNRLRFMASIQSGLTVDAQRDGGLDAVMRPYLRVANVHADELVLDSVTEITVPRTLADRCTLRFGDVLMTEGGDLDKLGRGTMWRDELPGALHQNHVFAVRPQPRTLNPEYLALLTRTQHARAYFERTGSKTTGLASTSSEKIGGLPVPSLSLKAQAKLVASATEQVELMRSFRARVTRQIDLLLERRQALITAAVTGQLEIPGVAA